MSRFISKQEEFGHLWMAESERFDFDPEDMLTIECAEIADELFHHAIARVEDDDFDETFSEWEAFIWEKNICLPLEQSCYQGVLLPSGQRAIRLESCPEKLLSPLRWFFELCPRHVRSFLALQFYLLLRIDRARRTGSPEWNPKTAIPAPEEHAFFRPPVLTLRNYAR